MKYKSYMLLGLTALACISGCSSASPSADTTNTNQPDTIQTNGTQSQTNTANIISENEAKQAAFQDAGVTESAVTGFRIRLEVDDGVQEYEVDFYANNQEYEYSIAAADGSIRSKDVDAVNTASGTAAGISEEQAKQAALNDAGVNEADATGFRIYLETDDGVQEYQVDFYANGQEYEYNIAAADGSIRSKDVDAVNTASGTGTIISESDAKQIALAKVTGAQESDIRIKLDWDDGKQVYEGSIIYNGTEYEFEIDAVDGTLRNWEEESIYD